MTIQIPPELEQRLASLASAQNRPSDDLAEEILESYVQHLETLRAEVRQAEERADAEGWLTTDEVFARLHAKLRRTA